MDSVFKTGSGELELFKQIEDLNFFEIENNIENFLLYQNENIDISELYTTQLGRICQIRIRMKFNQAFNANRYFCKINKRPYQHIDCLAFTVDNPSQTYSFYITHEGWIECSVPIPSGTDIVLSTIYILKEMHYGEE